MPGFMTMEDDPLDEVYAFVERAYVRLQVGDLLLRCVEIRSSTPLQQMVEGLVMAGPRSLGVLREMLAESGQRKIQIIDDLQQVYSEFESELKRYGVQLEELKNTDSIHHLTKIRLLALLHEQGVLDEEAQVVCLQILRNSQEMMLSLLEHVHLLEEIEIYIQDWLWGLAYQSARKDLVGERDTFTHISI
jgi:hypothetical protein